MKKFIIYSLLFSSIGLFCTSCGISVEIRAASANLVEKQKISLEAHITFHEAVVKTLNMYLDAQLARSERTYESTKKDYNKGTIDMLKKIYTDKTLSDADKKIKEEENRQSINEKIENAKKNYNERNELISKAKQNLQNASKSLIDGETVKSSAIEKMNKYLQQKRPSEKLLELINLDLEKYTGYVKDANKAIKLAETYIDKLNK